MDDGARSSGFGSCGQDASHVVLRVEIGCCACMVPASISGGCSERWALDTFEVTVGNDSTTIMPEPPSKDVWTILLLTGTARAVMKSGVLLVRSFGPTNTLIVELSGIPLP
jgi:hypothetical protein